ncbi:hypothetical protein HX870_18110 [Pseudomonas gingeri]|uniref:hypothetical protein n=1 Tax=Pseudomonas gingeri TaxID=117681 RepID=UPI0015A28096|nr:hypothetical protein [Pseudomonas gingeri]NWA24132.1 hypothetical protein [Pseudomonas gingeri]NWD69517.1 hypothetical protein [Pseudomonas gingeri]
MDQSVSWRRPDCASVKAILAHTLPSALLVFVLWLPFGFALTGLIEEWGVLGLFTTQGLFFIADPGSPLPAHALRPLTIFPQAIAYYLDPYSFDYWNWLLALSLFVKGAALSYIVSKMTGALRWGVVASILILIYPADTMQLSFRALHINWALALVLLGTALFIFALDVKNARLSYFLSAISAGLLSCACAMYEVSLLFSIIPLFVPFVLVGGRGAIAQARLNIGKYLIFFAGALAYIFYVYHTAPLVKSYQSGFATTGSVMATLQHSLPNLFSIGLLRTALGGWFDALRITGVEFSNYGYATAVVFLLTMFFWCFAYIDKCKTQGVEKKSSKGFIVRFLTVGVIFVLLGYAPFLLSVSHQSISQRTFLFASVGGAIITLSVLMFIGRLSDKMSLCGIAALFFIGFSTQLFQFHHYVQLSDRQKIILSDIVDKFDGEDAGKTILVLDKSGQLDSTWMFLKANLMSAMSYIYGHPINRLEICYMPAKEWQQTDVIGRKGQCEETADGWIFHYPTPISGPGIELTPKIDDKFLSKNDVITLVVDPDKIQVPNATPTVEKPWLEEESRTGLIYRGVIARSTPPLSIVKFKNDLVSDHYYWGFGNWWSMEFPIAGAGWRPAEWQINRFYHKASAWKINENADLYFSFLSVAKKHRLHGRFEVFAGPEIKASMKILINGSPVTLKWTSENDFEATVGEGLLKTGVNTITFSSAVNNAYYGLSAKLDWVEITKY